MVTDCVCSRKTAGTRRRARGGEGAPALGIMLAVLVLAAGCATAGGGDRAALPSPPPGGGGLKSLAASIPQDAVSSEPLSLAAQGIDCIGRGELEPASDLFNKALKLDPTNSWVQFLNGFTYHLRAVRGDGSLFDLAEEGYKLAIRFDKSNWIARYHLGLLYMDRKSYGPAQEIFAETLLFRGRDPDILYSMVVASYNARDPRTAAAVLSQLRLVEHDSPRVLRASAVVMAALDRPDEAAGYADRLELTVATDRGRDDVDLVRQRLSDWQHFYALNGAEIRNASAGTADPGIARDSRLRTSDPPGPVKTGAEPAGAEPSGDRLSASAAYRSAHGGDSSQGGPAAMPAEESSAQPTDKMIIVDVVIVRTEENLTTRKGVNLLNGLTLQFGNGDTPGFRWEDINTSPRKSDESFTDLGGNSPSPGNILASTITIPALSYSLNIFNSHSDRAEILARPTLVALNGQQSEFFSGVHISAAAVASGSIGGDSVSIDQDIGVKLVVTPELKEGGTVRLTVNAERTFLRTPSDDVVFENKVETSKTNVLANVEMRVGETLILSGLSEKETERIRDGVPGLQDLPLVQYFFAQKNTRDFQRSVLILLTPRVPQYVYHEAGRGKGATGESRALTELQARYSDWFKPYPNWASVFHHMQSNSLYREFRTGDVTLERWENQETLEKRLSQALKFLYF